MKKLIEEMQKKIKEGQIKFHGIIEVEEEENQKGKLSKEVPTAVKRNK